MSAEIWWRLTKPVSRPAPVSGPRADRTGTRPESCPRPHWPAWPLARSTCRGGDRRRGSTQNLAFFSVVAAAQLVWGVVSMAEAPR